MQMVCNSDSEFENFIRDVYDYEYDNTTNQIHNHLLHATAPNP